MNTTEQARNALRAWEDGKPKNFFTADNNLQHVLKRYLNSGYDEAVANLKRLGRQTATIIDELAKEEDHLPNHPVLQRYTGVGERVEEIEFHPNHDNVGRIIWKAGVMAIQKDPGKVVEQMGLYYLLCQNGEHGHLCSLACTAGLIRSLQKVGDDKVKKKFLPLLLNPDYDGMHHGAQFLTEVQGGSDVGANSVVATDQGDGTWRISGEKWFCSNINADQFLMTARATEADGTRGLGLFLVPRLLDDGSTNGFYIRRLKDKIGTCTLASAEVDFIDAVAYPVGPIENGFKNAVELVLNTSRLMNAIGSTGAMRRAYIEAAYYACHREAFGSAIASYPLVQEAVSDIMTEYYAATASTFYIAHLQDKIDTHTATSDDRDTYRLLVNVNKYITSIRASEMVHRAIEVLGGNGAIESFSILPRLYRDMIVLESWEGTHNVLCLQVMRDIAKYNIHLAFFKDMREQLADVRQEDLAEYTLLVNQAIDRANAMLLQLHKGGETYAQAHIRRFVDLLGNIAQAALLIVEAEWELDNNITTLKPSVIAHYVHKYLHPGYDPLEDAGYLARIERLMLSVQ